MEILLNDFVPILYFLVGGIIFVVIMQVISRLNRPRGAQSEEQQSIYECGQKPFTEEVHQQFNYQYYIYAILFVVMDVLSVVIYAWATSADRLTGHSILYLSIFTFILLIGFYYVAGTTMHWLKHVL